jgi:hypothetical protein
METCYNWNIEPTSALLVHSIWRPFRARCRGGWFLGLKPQAESSSPFGARDQMSKL